MAEKKKKKGVRIPEKFGETKEQTKTRMHEQDKRAADVGLPRLLLGNYRDKQIAEAAAKKHMRPPQPEEIEAHIKRISAGREGVPDNSGYKKKKAK